MTVVPEKFYHGSDVLTFTLKPFPSKLVNGASVVFFTPNRIFAGLFIGKWNDDILEVGFVDDELYIKPVDGDLNTVLRIFNKMNGYIYHTFTSTKKCEKMIFYQTPNMMRQEWVCEGEIKFNGFEVISAVYGTIIKNQVKIVID